MNVRFPKDIRINLLLHCIRVINVLLQIMEEVSVDFPRKEIVESLRKRYIAGCRVELLCMNDRQAPPIGTKGTVIGVDDIGSIMVKWDNGSGLSLAYGEDSSRILTE